MANKDYNILEEWKVAMSNSSAGEVLKDILLYCGLEDPSLNLNSLKSSTNLQAEMAFREGQRNIAMFIKSRMEDAVNESE